MIFGYQAVYDRDMFDAIDYAAENSFDYVSFDLNVPRFYIDQTPAAELDRVRGYAETKGVGIAFHAPGDNISLYADYPAIRRGHLEHFGAIIAAAERLGARHVVVHTGAPPSLKQVGAAGDVFLEEHAEYFRSVLAENILHLADQTKSVSLCIENYQFSAMTMAVVEKVLAKSDRVSLTWDIAKTYNGQLELNKAVEDFMWKHAARVGEIHAHDIIKGYRSHQIVGDGGIDFTKYASLLRRADMAVTIEVRPREAAAISRDRLRAMLEREQN